MFGSFIIDSVFSRFSLFLSGSSINLSRTESCVSQNIHSIGYTSSLKPNSRSRLCWICLWRIQSSSSLKVWTATYSNIQVVLWEFMMIHFARPNISSMGLNIGVYCGIVNARKSLFLKNSLITSSRWMLALSNKNTNHHHTLNHSSS